MKPLEIASPFRSLHDRRLLGLLGGWGADGHPPVLRKQASSAMIAVEPSAGRGGGEDDEPGQEGRIPVPPRARTGGSAARNRPTSLANGAEQDPASHGRNNCPQVAGPSFRDGAQTPPWATPSSGWTTTPTANVTQTADHQSPGPLSADLQEHPGVRQSHQGTQDHQGRDRNLIGLGPIGRQIPEGPEGPGHRSGCTVRRATTGTTRGGSPRAPASV